MKKLLILEELMQFCAALFLINLLPLYFPWWLWLLLFFAPDISMLGYVFGPKTGAIAYNLFHHKATSLVLAIAGYFLKADLLMITGLIFYAHSCFDRCFGYGMKYYDDFKNTHLGRIGR